MCHHCCKTCATTACFWFPHTNWALRLCYYHGNIPQKAQSVLPLCTWPTLSHNPSLFSPDEQLWNPFIFSLADRKWVTARHLTPRPLWLSEGRQVAQPIIVFILFLADVRTRWGPWPTSHTSEGIWSQYRPREKVLEGKFTRVALKLLR